MPTQSELNKITKRLKYLHSKKKMIDCKYRENPTLDNKERFYEITDVFDDELDKYYSNYIMFLKNEQSASFETYLALKKETVKRNLLANLISEWENAKKNELPIEQQKFNIHTELKK